MSSETVQWIALDRLLPHSANPRLIVREEVIAQIASGLGGRDFDPAHALLVRPLGENFQIISGHHRKLAAERCGIPGVPCWVREMDDDAAYMALVLGFLLCLYLASIAPNPLAIDASPELIEFRVGWYVAVAGILLLFTGAVIDGFLDSRREAPPVAVETTIRGTGYWYYIHSYRGGGPGEG